MKKLFLMICVCALAFAAKAQNVTVWYGANLAKTGGDVKLDSEIKPLNFGVTYTLPISEQFDWSAGLSYVTKGGEDQDPSTVQIDADALFNIYKTDDFKISILAGPYVGYVVNKDDARQMRKVDFGVGFGAQGTYKMISLKVGYELGIANLSKADDVSMRMNGIYCRLGYNF